MRFLPVSILLPVVTLTLAADQATGASLWNDCAHRVIAAIAFEELPPEARQAIVEILDQHPAAQDATFWAEHRWNGDDAALNRFMNAAVFPDDAKRPGPFKRYDIGRAHYINFRIMVDGEGRVEVLPPLQDLDDDDPHGDILESLATNLEIARDRSAPTSDRALALSWIFHLVGDLHQPLHNVARFSPATPNGDRGGNEVRFGEGNLHSYWDRALGTDATPESVEALAATLRAEHPRETFADRLAEPNPNRWSSEGVALALQTVYRNLDPSLAEFPDLPIGYDADARALARRQSALAGYRLADLLLEIATPPDHCTSPN
ncbi:S1/P1 nuclease [Tautonia rosea]|uniref:S1/P1 nuclease n=1 Tax=Tautonia rosea TaxID=2728037 RepID=UPI00147331FA|nr:S1/P1 nuclease [Tautonia rosea]